MNGAGIAAASFLGVVVFTACLLWLRDVHAPAPLARFIAFMLGLVAMFVVILAYKETP